MTELKLRPYQSEAIAAVFKAWSEGMQRPAIVLPTGAGKTVVFSALVKEFRDTYKHGQPDKGRRVMVLAHRDELVDQAIAKLRAMLPGVDIGKVKAMDRQTAADVMVCSVQTLSRDKALREMLDWQDDAGKIGLIITDECHHAAAASYRKIYAAFPNALQLGVTATMARGDGVGLGGVWDDVVYKRSILWMISKGYLTDVRTRQVHMDVDMASVGVSRGDWQAGQLGEAMMDAEADTTIARAYREHASDRQGIVFTPTVETAFAASEALSKTGVPSAVVHGKTPAWERLGFYDDYRRGRVQVLVNCMVLTEGFDMPQVSAIVVARPTRSESLYTQMVGRGLRTWPGKTDCLVLDLVGASANKLRTLIDLEPGAVEELREGESLAEAVVREEEEGNRKIKAGSLAFELRARDVDSFGASDHAWGRTPKGVMFIDCGGTHVFLWPAKEAGLWDVCLYRKGHQWHRTEYAGLSIGEAMAWGEAVADDFATVNTAKSAAWRGKPPSEKMANFASALGIEVPEGMRQGQLGALMGSLIAGRIFDPYVRG